MKILHIASFSGNIGDNINHNGFRKNFLEIVQDKIEWKELEMRKFYKSWNLLKFDDNFVEETKNYDLIVIGGGNFFDLYHDYSISGTTINIKKEIFEKIKCPIFFNSLGFDIYNGVNSELVKKFKIFIDYLLDNPEKYYVSFRNDGSKENFQKIYGYFDERIRIIPDGGFFIDKKNLSKQEKYIGINLAMDMFDKRFKEISYDEFCDRLSSVYLKFLKNYQEYKLLFFPHIITDYQVVLDVISRFDDFTKRTKIEIAPYLIGQGQEREYLKYYSKCRIVSGMRFHSNILAISLGIPVVPLVNYPQILNLYKELNWENKIIKIEDKKFEDIYYTSLVDTLENKKNLENESKNRLLELKKFQKEEYLKLKKWLNNNFYKN